MSKYVFLQVDPKRYEAVVQGYNEFIDAINDPSRPPVNFLSPLSPKMMEELELIRGVSRELQKKKEEDIKKQAAQSEKETAEEKKEGEGETEAEAKQEVEANDEEKKE